MKYSEMTIEKYYKEQNMLSFFFIANKEISYVKTNFYHFVKIISHSKKSNL
jgi:hypothetical protein